MVDMDAPSTSAPPAGTLEYLESFKPLLGVIAVLTVAATQSLFFVIKKPWCPRVVVQRGRIVSFEPVPPTLAEAAMSHIVPWSVLLTWRLAVLAFIVVIGAMQSIRLGGFYQMRYYTVWNWNLLGTYFLLAAVSTIVYRPHKQQRSSAGSPNGAVHSPTDPQPVKPPATAASPPGRPRTSPVQITASSANGGSAQMSVQDGAPAAVAEPWQVGDRTGSDVAAPERTGGMGRAGRFLADAVCVLFHINVTTVAIIDCVTWVALVPMLTTYNTDKVKAAEFSAIFYSFTSYSQHGLNAPIMLVELGLNSLTFRPYMVGHVGTWSLIYCAWAFTHYSLSGAWLYPFLDVSKWWAPLSYLALYLCHWLFFSVVWALFALKGKLLGKVSIAALPTKKIA